jgi:peptidoglycan/LPS O-acetylase OafA/YrhL
MKTEVLLFNSVWRTTQGEESLLSSIRVQSHTDTLSSDSETVDLTILTANDGVNNHTLKWSYSATSKDASPYSLNLTWANPDQDEQLGLEHRLDWTSDKMISIGNKGTNETANSITYVKDVNATNIPSTPAPVSFQTWSNGEPSNSQGPPRLEPGITHILYTRFFYNSSLPQRSVEFEQQCLVSNSVCSTDDYNLRNSTFFSQDSTAQVILYPTSFSPPLYAVIAESTAVGILILLFFHLLAVRNIFSKERNTSNSMSTAPSNSTLDFSQSKDSTLPTSLTAEEILIARSSSYGYNGSRRSSISGGHGGSIGHEKQFTTQSPSRSAPLSRRNSLLQSSSLSRPSSIAHGQSTRPRDITDLDMLFDGWDMEGDDDSEEFEQADRISGNFEKHDDEEDKTDENYTSEINVLPLFKVNNNSVDATLNASDSSSSNKGIGNEKDRMDSPQPRLIDWQIRRRTNDENLASQLAEPVAIEDAEEIARDVKKGTFANYPSLFLIIFHRIDNFLFLERTKVKTSSGQLRIDYLDGMRGAACLLVSLGHFTLIYYFSISNAGGQSHYIYFERWYRNLFGPISNNPSLLLGIFFALPSRTMCQRYLTRGGLAGLADTTVRRVPRIMFPVAAAATFEYFLIDVNAFKWVRRLASRSWSTWSYWQNYDNCLIFINAVITLPWGTPPSSPALVTGYATGVLWTIPVILNGMWTCMIATVIAFEIKAWYKRFAFYFIAVMFSWYSNTWDCYFLTGLIVGDLDSNMRYREKAARGIPVFFLPSFNSDSKGRWLRLHGKYLCYIFLLACCTEQWMTYAFHSPLSGLNNIEHAIHPDWLTSSPYIWEHQLGYAGYTSPAIFGFTLIVAFFMTADMSSIVQKFFRLRVFHWLGIHSMSVYLLHGIAWWTWSAWLVLALLKAGAPYWAATLTALITGYMLLFTMCMCFTYTFEIWAVLLSKAIWRATSGGLGRRT